MRLLRKRFINKTISIFLLLVFIQSIFLPGTAWALSNGPEQPEYASYEAPGATDLVNLITGDFSYNMPLLEVPGPEGSFAVPLFYHAGITPEQDASWVGLGFNLNVGCITRNVNGYPDDAYDNSLTVNVNDPGGSGFVKNYIFYRRSYDSQKGYGGAVSLFDIVGAEWNNHSGLTGGTAIGLHFNASGIKGSFGENVINVANVAMTVASFGGSGAASAGTTTAKETAIGIAQTVASLGPLAATVLSHSASASSYFNWSQSVERKGLKVTYKYWLDDSRTEREFGALYLGSTEHTTLSPGLPGPDHNQSSSSTPVVTEYPRIYKPPFALKPAKGFITATGDGPDLVASDMYLNVLPSENYSSVVRPSHISFDQYNVMTSGVDGQISPYRTEIGSVAQPKRYSVNYTSHNLVPFIEEDNGSNKVQFYYKGQFSNKYLYHNDTDFGITTSTYDAGATTTYDEQGKRYLQYTITNDKFLGGDRSEVDATRINGKKVLAGKNIEWYSNEQILSGAAVSNGFIDAWTSRSGLAPKGIGGFSITKEDGITYHYALPVYRYLDIDLIGVKGQQNVKYSRSVDQNPVAISWLLTGITGPDFIDRGTIGKLDDADWGYWVNFNYGVTSNDYWYRFPYYGYYDDGTSYSYSQGRRDQYYLNSIETRSHKALFIKGVRTDGLSSYLKRNDPNSGHPTETGLPTPTPPLYLDEIVLMTKSSFSALAQLGFSEQVNSSLGIANLLGNNGTLNQVYDIGDVQGNAGFLPFINANAIRRIKMVYETDESQKLCRNALNSFPNPGNPPAVDASDIYAGKQGKLTLRRVQFLGRNDAKIIPDYKFDYGFNPNYNQYTWDGWGYYNSAGTSDINSHKASSVNGDASAWSLTKITLPTGGSVTIDYERDSYSSIAGPPGLNGTTGNVPGQAQSVDNKLGGDIRVSQISTIDESGKLYRTKYSYTMPNTTNSSGVVAKEPELIKDGGNNFGLDNVYDFPNTPVLYSTVTVQSNYNPSADEYATKQIFEFITPDINMVSEVSTALQDYLVPGLHFYTVNTGEGEDMYLKQYLHKIDVRTAQMGKIRAISTYDKTGTTPIEKTTFDYTETTPSDQGKYTGGVLLSEVVPTTSNFHDPHVVKLIKTTKTYYPYALSKITHLKDGFSSSVEYKNWDFFTGLPIVAVSTSAEGFKIREEQTPAYSVSYLNGSTTVYPYASMGLKSANVANKNMLVQAGTAYTFTADVNGNAVNLISGAVQTWRNDWNKYRVYNNTTDSFADSDDEPSGVGIWRKGASYVWKGVYSRLQPNGSQTFTAATDAFNFTPLATNSLWQYTGEGLRFDHFSMPLEATDLNGISSALKMGYNEQLLLAGASNAQYNEIAFSSAEDLLSDKPYFGGEVARGSTPTNVTIVSSPVHTGTKAISLSSGYGFRFKASVQAGKTYRMSAWANSTQGALYCKLNGTETTLTQTISPVVHKLDGSNWYRIDANITVPGGTTSFETGVKSSNGSVVVFDDFRFQPAQASLTGYVYDPVTFQVLGVLNNDNLFTRYEYNDRGLLIRTYHESVTYGEKLVTESKDNYRRFHVNQ